MILTVNGDITSSSLVTVNAGGALGGNGRLPTVNLNGGTLAPGNSIGTLTVADNATINVDAGGTIELSGGEDEQDWWIRVGDTGPGLPPKAREHLFSAFQGGARKGGTGLGLAIAAELVRGHGGSLDLARSDAEGTEFLIHLPKSTGQA